MHDDQMARMETMMEKVAAKTAKNSTTKERRTSKRKQAERRRQREYSSDEESSDEEPKPKKCPTRWRGGGSRTSNRSKGHSNAK